jgi:uncharacterized protein YegL
MTSPISLTKKIEKLNADGHIELAKLVSSSAISLTKQGFDTNHVAKVALCLDISASMTPLFLDGTVKSIVKKALAQGIVFDDDGKIDVFTFGIDAYYEGDVGADDFEEFSSKICSKKLEGATYYCKAVDKINQHYKDNADGYPAYVIFVTDGAPSNKETAERSIRSMSESPIFIQFVGIGAEDYDPRAGETEVVSKPGFMKKLFGIKNKITRNSNTPSAVFRFLSNLDNLSNRPIDNTGFFAVKNTKKIENEKLYKLLMAEYPEWLAEAKSRGIVTK